MDMKTCNNCTLFREKYKDAKTIKREKYLLAILEKLPRNPDGSVNYEDLEFADNARKQFEGGCI